MKKILLMLAISAVATAGAEAQTNRAYRTDMQDERIRQDERRGSTLTPTPTRLNTGSNNQETMPARSADTSSTGTFSGNATGNTGSNSTNFNNATISNDRWRYQQYDTSKNNGRIIGGGSGTTTDPHPNGVER